MILMQKSHSRYQFYIYISLFILLYCNIVFSYSNNYSPQKSPPHPQNEIDENFLKKENDGYIENLNEFKSINSFSSNSNSNSNNNNNQINNFIDNNKFIETAAATTDSNENYHSMATLQNVTLSLDMTGGISSCTESNCSKNSIYFEDFACSDNNGDWNAGTLSFLDPLPFTPNNQMLILKRVSMVVNSNFYFVGPPTTTLVFLGIPMVNMFTPPSSDSTCINCVDPYIPGSFFSFPNGLEGYKYGQNNTLSFQLTSPDNTTACISRVDLTFYFGPVNYRVFSISPQEGSSDGNQQVVVNGNNFFTSNNIICRFGSNSVGANYINATTLICKTPALDTTNLTPGDYYNSTFQISEDGGVSFSSPIFFLYKIPIQTKPSNNNNNRLILIVLTTVGSVSLFLSFLAVFYCFKRYKRGKLLTIGNKKEISPLLKSDYKTLFEIKPIDIGEIVIQNRIGRGSCAEVFTGTWRGITVAIKKAKLLNDDDEDFLNELAQEATIMSQLRHPNICQFLGTCKNPPEVLIVMEYMPMGSLYRILHDNTIPLDWSRMKSMALDIAKGMNYLHCSDPIVIHRDLKSHNLLVDEHFRVKISDFGLSTRFKKHLDRSTTMTPVGTPAWSAPEVIRNQQYTEKADVYSFGIVLWECATRMDPYAGLPTFQVICAVGKEGLRPPTPKSAPPEFIRLIIDCWTENPSQRPSFQEIVKRLESVDIKGWGEIPFIKFNPISLNQNQIINQNQQNQSNNNNSNIIINNLISN